MPPFAPIRRSRWEGLAIAAAIAWMLAFAFWFFTLRLPNNPQWTRGEVLRQTPGLLLDLAAPSSNLDRPSGWRDVSRRADNAIVALLIIAGCWAIGLLVLRALRLHALLAGAERAAMAYGLGFLTFGLFVLGCGRAGWLSWPCFLSVLLGSLGAEFILRLAARRHRANVASDIPWHRRRFFRGSPIGPVTLLAVAPFLVAMALGSLLPPVDFDVKEYHLGGPKEWFVAVIVEFLPHNVYTSFPFLTEMALLAGMVLRGDWFRGGLAGQGVLMAFAPFTAAAVFAILRPISLRAAWSGVLIFLTIPWTYRISTIAYAEGGLTFYTAATLLAFVSWRRAARGGEAGQSRRLLLCGLLAGAAAGCKYPAALTVVIPTGLGLLLVAGQALRCTGRIPARTVKVIRTGLLYSAGVVAAFGPWAIRNVMDTGNPVYPLLYGVFGATDWSEELHTKWQRAHSPPVELLREPLRIPRDLSRHALDVAAHSDWQSALVVMFAPLALIPFVGKRCAEDEGTCVGDSHSISRPIISWSAAAAAWLFLTWWACTHRIDRFWLPLLPALAVLGGAGLDSLFALLETSRSRPAGQADEVRGSVRDGRCRGLQLCVHHDAAGRVQRLAGRRSRGDQRDPHLEYPDPRTASAGGRRVLMVGEAEMFDARFDYRYNTVFDFSLLQQAGAFDGQSLHDKELPLRPPAEIRQRLRDMGISHVFVNWLEILRYREPGSYGYTEFISPDLLQTLVQQRVLRAQPLAPSTALLPLESLSPGKQQELHAWGPELQVVHRGTPAVVVYQLFVVNPP